MQRLAMLVILLAACSDGGESPGDGAVLGDGVASGSDAPFACADDGGFEPNDATTNAFQLPPQQTISLAGLAICPASDVDHFRTTVANQGSLGAIVQFEGAGPVAVAILNAGGTAIANGTTSGFEVRASVSALPAGTYFVRVSAGSEHNYRISVNATQ